MQSHHRHHAVDGEGGKPSGEGSSGGGSAHSSPIALRRRVFVGFSAIVLLAFIVGLSTVQEEEDVARGKKKQTLLTGASDGLGRDSKEDGTSYNPSMSSLRLGGGNGSSGSRGESNGSKDAAVIVGSSKKSDEKHSATKAAQLAGSLKPFAAAGGKHNKRQLHDVDLHPTNLSGQCVTIRFATPSGSDKDGGDVTNVQSLNIDEALQHIRDGAVPTVGSDQEDSAKQTMRIGLEIVEDPSSFTSLHGDNPKFHLFHFLEFMVISASTLYRIESALPLGVDINAAWIYAPHMTGQEICWGYDGVQCIIADLALNGRYNPDNDSDTEPNNHIYPFPTYGLEVNDNFMLSLHPSNRGEPYTTMRRRDPTEVKKKSFPRSTLPDPMPSESQRKARRTQEVLEQADALIMINRPDCDRHDQFGTNINQIWAKYMPDFPAEWWSNHVWNGMGLAASEENESASKEKKKVVTIGYIERQHTDRAMPTPDHEWLVSYLSGLAAAKKDNGGSTNGGTASVEYLHLRMEDHSSVDQIKLASRCDVMVGLHGNGLSHQLWMKPKSALVEIYWHHKFHYAYPNMAELMGHEYLGIWNGRVLDNEGIMEHHDMKMLEMEHRLTPEEQERGALPKEARAAIRRLIQERISKASQE